VVVEKIALSENYVYRALCPYMRLCVFLPLNEV